MPSGSPQSLDVVAGGLKHRVLQWDGGGTTTLLLLHGFLDCGGSWAPLVRCLPDDLHCIAPDLRGHGATDRIGPGGAYHFLDYVRDVRDLVDSLGRERLVVVGHSMGGGVAYLFTGAWPEDVERLVLLEGLGPPEEDVAEGPARLRRWIRETRNVEAGDMAVRSFASLADAAERLRSRDSFLTEERALELAGWLTVPQQGGGVTWAHDPLHRTRTPHVYRPSSWAPFLAAIDCPVLTVSAEQSWYRWPDLADRRAQLRDHRHLVLSKSSHMLHHDVPENLAVSLEAFLGGEEPAGSQRSGEPS